MRRLSIIVAIGAFLAGAVPVASGGPARFWISEFKDDPGVPAALTINAAIGRPRTFYIWAQPATDTGGAFRKLEAYSLDIVTLDTLRQPELSPFVDFIDGTFKLDNPTVSTLQRFQNITDSTRPAAQGGPLTSEWTATEILGPDHLPDAVKGLQGVSPFASPSTRGIGDMAESPPYQVGSGSNAAWRVGEFSFQALESSGTNHLFLQIGFHGMRHEDDGEGDPALATQVVFGSNASPIYTAGPSLSHRQTTLPGDTFDLRINAIPALPGDFNGNGSIGQEDYVTWQSAFGLSVATLGDGADGNGDGAVNAADYVMWRKLLAFAGNSALPIVEVAVTAEQNSIPEPATSTLGTAFLLLMLFEVRLRMH